MAEALFEKILVMSAMASVVIVAVLLLRLCLRRAPKIFSYALWGVVLFRLLCPVSFPSELSFVGLVQKGILAANAEDAKNSVGNSDANGISEFLRAWRNGDSIGVTGKAAEGDTAGANGKSESAGKWMTGETVDANGKLEAAGELAAGTAIGANEKSELGGDAMYDGEFVASRGISANILKNVAQLIAFYGCRIWLAGLVLLAGYSIYSTLRMRRILKEATHETENIYNCNLATPFVYGIFRPGIYLPAGLKEREREYVLLHEQIHIRRGDHMIRMLGFLALCLHWFNPLVWAAFFLSGKDMEMSCDEAVLKRIGNERKKEYSASLLAFATGKQIVGGMPVAFGEGDTKSRIKNVLRYQKPAAVLVGAVAVICVAAGVMLLANPKTKETGTVSGRDENPQNTADADGAGFGGLESDTELGEKGREWDGQTMIIQCSTDVMNETAEKTHLVMGEALRKFSPEQLAAITSDGEIFKEEELAGVLYRVYKNGIFRVENGEEICIYPYFTGVEPDMSVFDGRLYFLTYSEYLKDMEHTLDWIDDTIAWVDLTTQESGTFQVNEWTEIKFLSVWDIGMISLSGVNITEQYATLILPEPEKKVYWAMDGTGFEIEHPVTGKSTEAEKKAFGLAFSGRIRGDAPKLWDVSDRENDRTLAWLDLNGDGTVEKIRLGRDESEEGVYDAPWDAYCLQVEDSVVKEHRSGQANGIYAFCPDGKEIILALYSAGPSGDPETHFFVYRENELQSLGGICADIRKAEFHENGTFTETLRNDTIQTDRIRVSWEFDEAGQIVEVPQETYEYVTKNKVKLLTELEVQTEPGVGKIFTAEPQTICFTAVNQDFSWIQIELEDGSRGWFELEKLVQKYQEEYIMRNEVFADLQFMD